MLALALAQARAEPPVKSRPKVQAPRKRKSLVQKCVGVREPQEEAAATLYSQLNDIRKQEAVQRCEQQARRRGVRRRPV